jgi:hypothetical protein
MKKNINIIKKTILVSALSLGFVTSANAIDAGGLGQMQEWPVHDQVVAKKIEALTQALTNANIDTAQAQAQLQQNNAFAINSNIRAMEIQNDLKKVVLDAAPTLDKCIATTRAIGMGRANAQAARQQYIQRFNLSQNSKDAVSNGNINAVTQSVAALGTCKATDKGIVPGCTEVGKFAGKDEDASVLLNGTHTNNLTIEPDQQKVGQQYIRNTVYALAPTMPDNIDANNSQIVAKRKVWNARASVAALAMADTLSQRSSIPLAEGSSLKITWDNFDDVYSQIYNKATKPANPSDLEMMNALVKRDFMYGGVAADANSQSEVGLLRQLNEKMALNNNIQMTLLNETIILKLIQANVLMQLLAPVSNDTNDLVNK